MGNMGMADSEYHEKMMRLGQQRDAAPARGPVDDHGEGTTLDNPVLYQREARPVDDALARLLDCERQHWAPDPNRQQIAQEFDAALATVREELQRLREERDALNVLCAAERGRGDHHLAGKEAAEAEADKYRKATDQQARRAEAAEAEVERLTEERDAEKRRADHLADRIKHGESAAEDESQRYREGLREAVDMIRFPCAECKPFIDKARALLADSPDGPDDFCEHGYTTENAAHPSAGLERCPTCSPTGGGGAK